MWHFVKKYPNTPWGINRTARRESCAVWLTSSFHFKNSSKFRQTFYGLYKQKYGRLITTVFSDVKIYLLLMVHLFMCICTTEQDVWPSGFDGLGSKMIGYRLNSQDVLPGGEPEFTYLFQNIPWSQPDSFQLSTDSNNPHSKVFGFSWDGNAGVLLTFCL